jgi:hypothetical protein
MYLFLQTKYYLSMVKDIKKRTRSTTTSSINVRTRQIIHQDRVRPHRTRREHELNGVTFDARLYPRRPRRAPTPGPSRFSPAHRATTS